MTIIESFGFLTYLRASKLKAVYSGITFNLIWKYVESVIFIHSHLYKNLKFINFAAMWVPKVCFDFDLVSSSVIKCHRRCWPWLLKWVKFGKYFEIGFESFEIIHASWNQPLNYPWFLLYRIFVYFSKFAVPFSNILWQNKWFGRKQRSKWRP